MERVLLFAATFTLVKLCVNVLTSVTVSWFMTVEIQYCVSIYDIYFLLLYVTKENLHRLSETLDALDGREV